MESGDDDGGLGLEISDDNSFLFLFPLPACPSKSV